MLTRLTADLAAGLPAWFPDEASLLLWGGPAWSFPLDPPQLALMIEGSHHGPQPERDLWALVEDGRLVAECRVGYDWKHGVARLAQVGVAPSCRGQGRAVPFLREVLARTFAHREIVKVELTAYPFNRPAIRSYGRLGFVQEGLRRSCVQVGAERWDAAVFGLLRPEWAVSLAASQASA